METKQVNGRMITYGDIIIHNTDMVFSFRDRLRILIGRKVRSHSEIYCAEERISVLGSTCTTSVARSIPRKRQGFGMVAPSE